MSEKVISIHNAPEDLSGKWVRVEQLVTLREQNRVLATHLSNLVEWALEVTKDWVVDDDSTLANDLHMIWQAQAALTATSQPAKPAGKVHACDIPGCVSCANPEDATSQEGQHG